LTVVRVSVSLASVVSNSLQHCVSYLGARVMFTPRWEAFVCLIGTAKEPHM